MSFDERLDEGCLEAFHVEQSSLSMKVVPDVGLGPTRGKTVGRFSGLSEIWDLLASKFSFPTLRGAPSCPAS